MQLDKDHRVEYIKNSLTFLGLSSLIIAVSMVFIWAVVYWNSSHNRLHQLNSEIYTLKNGQSLQIAYPAFIFADDRQSDVRFIIQGTAKNPASQAVVIKASIPPDLIAVKPETQKYSQTIALEFPLDYDGSPAEKVIGLINARTTVNILSKKQAIQIESPELEERVAIYPKVEALFPASLRHFLDISVNKNSPAILLATGLLSVGSFMLAQQLEKQQEREAVLDNREYIEIQKELDGFQVQLKTDPVEAARSYTKRSIQFNVADTHSRDLKILEGMRRQILLTPWQEPLFNAVIDSLVDRKYYQALNISENIQEFHILETHQPPSRRDYQWEGDSRAEKLVNLSRILINLNINSVQVQAINLHDELTNLLAIYTDLGEAIHPIVVHELERLFPKPDFVVEVAKVFLSNNVGISLLKDCNIGHELEYLVNTSNTPEETKSAALSIISIRRKSIQWRPLWPPTEPYTSSVLVHWLRERMLVDSPDQTPFGSEYGELDPRLAGYIAYEHPLFETIRTGIPVVVFGASGSGKTTLALRLASDFQLSSEYSEQKVFPIYCTLAEEQISIPWIISTISRALIDFVSDNPRNFLYADVVAREAMGRLIALQLGNIDNLRIKMRLSRNYPSFIGQEILNELVSLSLDSIAYAKPEESLDLLHQAIPEGFQRIDFFIDMQATDKNDIQAEQLNKLVRFSLPLVRQNVILKIFTPSSIEPQLNKPAPVLTTDLTWTEAEIRGMLNTRTGRNFARLCNYRDLREDPVELMVKAASGSPRRLIKLGNLLMHYAETHLREGQPLDRAAFKSAGILD